MTVPDNNQNDPVAFVDALLDEAVAAGASDIYWIPAADSCEVRFRVNGVQRAVRRVPDPRFSAQCAARLKVLSGMLTYRTKTPQDGAIRGVRNRADAELRVAAMPTIHGERISIRILAGGQGGGRHLDELGFAPPVLAALRQMLQPAAGLIILTGPTGCGKTTTIYAMIRELLRNSQDPASIIAIEDPVECVIPGISQVSLTRAGADWTYEDALRAALRQDVKTLVIGEIRDCEIARVALNAALSGHRVITTLHAGDIPAVYARLLHQGFEAFLIAAAITGVLSQRLAPAVDSEGRVPVAACLCPDDAWRDFVISNPGLAELRRQIRSYPGADLRAAALEMAAAGRISKEDALLL